MKKKSFWLAAVAALAMLTAGGMALGANATDSATGTNEAAYIIEAPITATGYPVITVEEGKPVTINFQAAAKELNGCNNEILIPAFGIDKKLVAGDNFVTITPTEAGQYPYSCWMGMMQSTINVVKPGSGEVGAQAPGVAGNAPAALIPGFGNGSGVAPAGGCGCCGR